MEQNDIISVLGVGFMDFISSMNQALSYIEENLTEVIDFSEVSRIALCSEYHFKKMFSILSGISLTEYIRRRRMTLAAIDLKNNELRIVDIAVKYGYSSADSFSRAFSSVHGVLPSDARHNHVRLKAYPKMTFQVTVKGVKEMNYRIVEKEAFKIAGLKKRVPIVFEGVNPEIAAMSGLLTPEIVMNLKLLSNIEPRGMISASANFSEGRMEETGELDHYLGVATTSDETSDFEVLDVEGGSWAVFESVGPFPETLQDVWGRIYAEWLPTSGYEIVPGPEILWNESPDTSNPEYRSEIWVPVKKMSI